MLMATAGTKYFKGTMLEADVVTGNGMHSERPKAHTSRRQPTAGLTACPQHRAWEQ